MVMSLYAGAALERIGSYSPLFAVAGAASFLALLSVHLRSPRLERVSVEA